MRRNTVYALIAAVPFVIAEFQLSYLVQRSNSVTEVMYFSVVLAFIFAMTSIARTPTLEYNLVRLGLGITLLADYFLVVCLPARQLDGVVVFCLVQMAYFAALVVSDKNRIRRTVHIAVRAGLCALIVPVAFLVLGDSVDALAIWSAVYYANLVCNMVFAFIDFERWWLFGLGLLAFALCDASIGFDFLVNSYIGAPEGSLLWNIVHSGLNLAWIFYVPCLTMISLSTHFPFAERLDTSLQSK
ncbi:MAG: hypothetical protein IKV43_02250 [Clostridia bacterium]|nr:hypothetical protein [Clostridia bacterium]